MKEFKSKFVDILMSHLAKLDFSPINQVGELSLHFPKAQITAAEPI
jgi:hypothetical protein